MSEWNLDLNEKVKTALAEAATRHPHLKALIGQHLGALLDFPPVRWYRIEVHGNENWFFPEPGQKVRFTGLVDLEARVIRVTRFSVHE